MELVDIRDKITDGDYRLSDHAVKRMISRSINRLEIEEAVLSGEIIESYSGDKYSPSCLVYGKSKARRHLHVQVSFPPVVVVITVYEPDAVEWVDHRTRRVGK